MSDTVRTHFDRRATDYDGYRRNLIVNYDEYYSIGIDMLACSKAAPRVLDLGAGTGLSTLFLLKRFPDARVTLLDFSEEMLSVARERFRDNPNINYVVGDYRFLLLDESLGRLSSGIPGGSVGGVPGGVTGESVGGVTGGVTGESISGLSGESIDGMLSGMPGESIGIMPDAPFDIVISGLSIHHLTFAEKQELTSRIYSLLAPDGEFLNSDMVRCEIEKQEQEMQIRLKSFLSLSLTEEQIQKFEDSQSIDIPETVSGYLELMRKAGFQFVDCLYRYWIYGVFYGRK